MIDKLFQQPIDRFSDPQLRDWDQRLSHSGTTASLEVDWPPIVLGQTSAEMSIHLAENGHSVPSEPMSWDDELNAVLIEKAVRAVDAEQEATRFSLGLRAAFQRAGRDFGDGYFNSVLFNVLKESGLDQHPLIAPLFEFNSIFNPESRDQTGRYIRCHGMIESAIRGRAHELADSLKYPLDEAKEILVAALADYLDRRFSVSIRRERGLL